MTKPTKTPHADSALIDALGGTSATAKLCDVEPQAVSQWRATGIPKARLMFLRVAKPAIFKASKPAKVAA